MSMKGFRWIYMWFMWSILSEVKHVVSTGSAKTQGISCYPHGTGPSWKQLLGGWELIMARTKLGIPSWERSHIPYRLAFLSRWFSELPQVGDGLVPWRVFFFQTSNLLNLSFFCCAVVSDLSIHSFCSGKVFSENRSFPVRWGKTSKLWSNRKASESLLVHWDVPRI